MCNVSVYINAIALQQWDLQQNIRLYATSYIIISVALQS
jgi:hypothetical protein